MVKNRKLAKSISDASFAAFYATLSYKAAWYGKEVVKVDRWFASSKTCSCCGWKNEILTLADRTFNCPVCGFSKDRDLNAAENILPQALSVKRRANVRPY
jgi:putative transposase